MGQKRSATTSGNDIWSTGATLGVNESFAKGAWCVNRRASPKEAVLVLALARALPCWGIELVFYERKERKVSIKRMNVLTLVVVLAGQPALSSSQFPDVKKYIPSSESVYDVGDKALEAMTPDLVKKIETDEEAKELAKGVILLALAKGLEQTKLVEDSIGISDVEGPVRVVIGGVELVAVKLALQVLNGGINLLTPAQSQWFSIFKSNSVQLRHETKQLGLLNDRVVLPDSEEARAKAELKTSIENLQNERTRLYSLKPGASYRLGRLARGVAKSLGAAGALLLAVDVVNYQTVRISLERDEFNTLVQQLGIEADAMIEQALD